MSTFNFSFSALEKVSESRLRRIWSGLTKQPFTNIEAYILSAKEYEKAMDKLASSPNVIPQGMYEYGLNLPPKGSDAVVFEPELSHFLILINKEGLLSPEQNLVHELSHISKGELKLH